MRYFIRLSYKGTQYAGWQRQPNALSVQEVIEDKLSLFLRQPIEVVGCGRTDAGVHASDFFLHLDVEESLPQNFQYRLNQILPNDIAFREIILVEADAHARYSATSRGYIYYLHLDKNPFLDQQSTYYPRAKKVDPQLVQEAAQSIIEYEDFFPFCKSGSDVKHTRCEMTKSEWIFHEDRWEYHIEANRFLRGMVRLITGMCMLVGAGQLTVEQVHQALTDQTRLPKDLSMPPEGLFLTKVAYPEHLFK